MNLPRVRIRKNITPKKNKKVEVQFGFAATHHEVFAASFYPTLEDTSSELNPPVSIHRLASSSLTLTLSISSWVQRPVWKVVNRFNSNQCVGVTVGWLVGWVVVGWVGCLGWLLVGWRDVPNPGPGRATNRRFVDKLSQLQSGHTFVYHTFMKSHRIHVWYMYLHLVDFYGILM